RQHLAACVANLERLVDVGLQIDKHRPAARDIDQFGQTSRVPGTRSLVEYPSATPWSLHAHRRFPGHTRWFPIAAEYLQFSPKPRMVLVLHTQDAGAARCTEDFKLYGGLLAYRRLAQYPPVRIQQPHAARRSGSRRSRYHSEVENALPAKRRYDQLGET